MHPLEKLGALSVYGAILCLAGTMAAGVWMIVLHKEGEFPEPPFIGVAMAATLLLVGAILGPLGFYLRFRRKP